MILVWMIIVLMAGGLLCWLLAMWNQSLVKWVALLAVLIDLVLAGSLWAQHGGIPYTDSNSWMIDYKVDWVPAYGISFHLAADGFSLVMLLL